MLLVMLLGCPLHADDALKREIFPQDQNSEPATTQTVKGVTMTLVDNHTLKVSNGQTFGATVYYTVNLLNINGSQQYIQNVVPNQETLIKVPQKIVSFTIDRVQLSGRPASEDAGKSGKGKNLNSN
jgi:hypothetical protein